MKIPCEGCLVFPLCYNKNIFTDDFGGRLFEISEFTKCSKIVDFIDSLTEKEDKMFAQEMRKLFKVGVWYETQYPL